MTEPEKRNSHRLLDAIQSFGNAINKLGVTGTVVIASEDLFYKIIKPGQGVGTVDMDLGEITIALTHSARYVEEP